MQLLNAVQNEAILSNVGEIGEFRIRNSAKAFNILSSGLYANKIRAIIRELSCNAVDSHVAAGKKDVPFDVHLPSQLEPWFAIRDYGTGLSHQQVTSIYTTYFESTKTESNDFIGALGLGSKSPFSYTDNFTVTAVKDGRKGIYTAFINEQGVPSIALMMEEDTDEASGVEVKFSVNDYYDFSKFRDEARTVYTYFALRPVIGGVSNFEFRDVEYETKDIIPGVHSYRDGRRSVAVMGNIAYPIEVPNAEQTLGDLRGLLSCGLELHFSIGELDFQASREGLSYIPQTISSIKSRLEAVNAALAVVIAREADSIPNLWERATFLYKKYNQSLWQAAVKKYVVDTNLPTFDNGRYGGTKTFKMSIQELANKYNIQIRGFEYRRGAKSLPNLKHSTDYSDKKDANGHNIVITHWPVTVDMDMIFVINDTNVGAVERAKYHYRQTKPEDRAHVMVLERVVKDKEMDTKSFFASIQHPPEKLIVKASTLIKKERNSSGLGKNVTIMRMEKRGYGGYYKEREMTWRDAGKIDDFDDTTTYYYLPLKGFEVQSKVTNTFDSRQFVQDLSECGLPNLVKEIYGVRKSDIEYVRTQKNWINIENFLSKELTKPIDNKLVMSLVLNAIDDYNNVKYNDTIVEAIANDKSPYKVFLNKLKGFNKVRYSEQSLKRLCQMYAPKVQFNPEAQVEAYRLECHKVQNRYPLLAYMSRVPVGELVEYINMVDTQKGV